MSRCGDIRRAFFSGVPRPTPSDEQSSDRKRRGGGSRCGGRAGTAGQGEFVDAGARQRRRRLRRYRDESALRVPRSRRGRGGARRRYTRGRARRAVDDSLGADHCRDHQVRAAAAAGRQQRGGRHALADRARDARTRPAHPVGFHARGDRRLDVPRRFGDHAGDLGALRGGGPEAPVARVRTLRRSAHHRDPVRIVRGAKPRHREGRGVFRPGHAGVVRGDRAGRAPAHQRRPRRAAGDQPVVRGAICVRAQPYRAGHARGDFPGRHRRRGALCRSRTLRPQADPDGLAVGRAAGPPAELFRTGRARPGEPVGDCQSVLSVWCRIRCCCRWSRLRPPRP